MGDQNFTAWKEPVYSLADEGDSGLFPAIDMERKADGARFHLHVFEDGNGGLQVYLWGSEQVAVEVGVDPSDNAADITFRRW
ncbi:MULTISPECIES: hypothetical protein [Mycobacterium avium complex (MAC)]|uniref:Uncharacterized protein n=1 Tax=Mycobacterium intracellulare subsp. chimaera TaxID=222805 RepID=A0ABT7P3K0_MYCIT|nr:MULTISPECIES: hypothetical protein [Mycobacterium avium complex (MAC)]AOS94739.1 hypothetical protein AN480_26955 [Mycobacterium intracellulare subsp. chimaera]MDM3927854.1 hypothetical protein [Mycobacterium intracellulare subsp. chimaera]PBA69156.1 hypothetical protein CKJ76_24345 [Mycobacterium avium]